MDFINIGIKKKQISSTFVYTIRFKGKIHHLTMLIIDFQTDGLKSNKSLRRIFLVVQIIHHQRKILRFINKFQSIRSFGIWLKITFNKQHLENVRENPTVNTFSITSHRIRNFKTQENLVATLCIYSIQLRKCMFEFYGFSYF